MIKYLSRWHDIRTWKTRNLSAYRLWSIMHYMAAVAVLLFLASSFILVITLRSKAKEKIAMAVAITIVTTGLARAEPYYIGSAAIIAWMYIGILPLRAYFLQFSILWCIFKIVFKSTLLNNLCCFIKRIKVPSIWAIEIQVKKLT